MVPWTLPGAVQCLCGSHYRSGETVHKGKTQISHGPEVIVMVTPRRDVLWILFFACCPCCLWSLVAMKILTISKQALWHEESHWGRKIFLSQWTLWIFSIEFWDRWLNIIAPNITMTGRVWDKVRERRSLFLAMLLYITGFASPFFMIAESGTVSVLQSGYHLP